MVTEAIHIAHVLPAVTLGGLWRHVQAVQELPPRFKATVVSLFDADELSALEGLSVPIIRLRRPLNEYRKEPHMVSKTASALAQLRVNLVHSYHCYSDFYALHAASGLGLPAIRSVHGITQVDWDDPFQRPTVRTNWSAFEIEKQLGLDRHVTSTIVVSQQLKDRLVSYGFPEEKVHVCYFGVNVDSVQARPSPDSGALRPGSPLIVGFVNRLEPVKNPLVLVDIARALAQRGVCAKFVIAGDGRLGPTLRDEVNRLALTHMFVEVPTSPTIWDTLPALDLLLITSLSEGLPIVMLEAMARGIPVLATNVGGIPEVIKDGINGFLITAGDEASAITKFQEIADGKHDLTTISRMARETVRDSFTLSRHLSTMASLYERAVRMT